MVLLEMSTTFSSRPTIILLEGGSSQTLLSLTDGGGLKPDSQTIG